MLISRGLGEDTGDAGMDAGARFAIMLWLCICVLRCAERRGNKAYNAVCMYILYMYSTRLLVSLTLLFVYWLVNGEKSLRASHD